jgi:hypothetical protein
VQQLAQLEAVERALAERVAGVSAARLVQLARGAARFELETALGQAEAASELGKLALAGCALRAAGTTAGIDGGGPCLTCTAAAASLPAR